MSLVSKFSEEKKKKENLPDLKPGQRVNVHQKIIEGDKKRIQIFDGLIISVSKKNTLDASFTVRKVFGKIGVEKVFSLHSKAIEKIEITREHKIRRSKLYFMRERLGKQARLKDKSKKTVTKKDKDNLKTKKIKKDSTEKNS